VAAVQTVLADSAVVKHFRSDGGVAPTPTAPLPEDWPGRMRALGRAMDFDIHAHSALEKSFSPPTAPVRRNSPTSPWMTDRPDLVATRVPSNRSNKRIPRQPGNLTPAWDGRRLFVFFGSYGLLC